MQQNSIIEIIVGNDGIAFSNSVDGPQINFTTEQIWQAMAEKGPKPSKWSEIDPSLPDVAIEIRVRGTVTREEGPQADAYYASRALKSRLGAWASPQSQPLKDRATLVAAVAKMSLKHGTNPARPPFWGGFRITPTQIEFWADGAFRLHDRFVWVRQAEGCWKVTRLAP